MRARLFVWLLDRVAAYRDRFIQTHWADLPKSRRAKFLSERRY